MNFASYDQKGEDLRTAAEGPGKNIRPEITGAQSCSTKPGGN